jgi:hypothetical protein
LIFSQLLFSPQPVSLLHQAERAALADVSGGLMLTARALADDDDATAEEAVRELRELRDRLSELARTRRAGPRVAAHSLWWHSHQNRVLRESENAGILDLLGSSALLLARTAMTVDAEERAGLQARIHELADVIGGLAAAPGDKERRDTAAKRTLRMLEQAESDRSNRPANPAELAFMMAAGDVLGFTGLEPAHPAGSQGSEEGAVGRISPMVTGRPTQQDTHRGAHRRPPSR